MSDNKDKKESPSLLQVPIDAAKTIVKKISRSSLRRSPSPSRSALQDEVAQQMEGQSNAYQPSQSSATSIGAAHATQKYGGGYQGYSPQGQGADNVGQPRPSEDSVSQSMEENLQGTPVYKQDTLISQKELKELDVRSKLLITNFGITDCFSFNM